MRTKQLLLTAFIAAATALGTSSAFAQVKIGTNPTTIGANNNLEVEASTAGRKTSVDKTTGQVTIADGTQGLNKVLTSDANGGASWRTLRSTSVVSFPQTTPGSTFTITPTPGGASAAGGSYCALPALGSSVPACAIDLQRNASFSTVTGSNDVVFDLTGLLTVASNTNGQVQLFILLYADKTTPGVYELIDSYAVSAPPANCTATYLNYKTSLKNLPARSYNVKTYAIKWVNQSTSTAQVGIGAPAITSVCGQSDFPNQKLTVTVSE
jgi:hypothetical protein